MADIFISYAREDRDTAQSLAQALESHGWSVWWDHQMQTGRRFRRVITEELNTADCVVVLWSETSTDSDWVLDEAERGKERDVLVPVSLGGVRPPLGFGGIHTTDLTGWQGEGSHLHFGQLVEDIKGLLGNPVSPRMEAPRSSPASEPSKAASAAKKQPKTAAQSTIKKPARPEEPPDFLVFRDVDEPWCPEMVVLPAGEFMMGSPDTDEDVYDDEKPQHKVTIGYRFAVGRYPVTFDEYDRFCEATGRDKPEDEDWGRGRRPVINVSWDDGKAYVEWLGQETGKPYRLLSEAEWEYACRAGTETRYSCGDSITDKDANFGGKISRTTEVGSYPGNPWGLCDMHGNVWEWVEDVYHDTYKGAPDDGGAWTKGGDSNRRVVRGGSWYLINWSLRSAIRGRLDTDYRGGSSGFRVARTV